jgi:tetratricopeptide (TPR) repeat protein
MTRPYVGFLFGILTVAALAPASVHAQDVRAPEIMEPFNAGVQLLEEAAGLTGVEQNRKYTEAIAAFQAAIDRDRLFAEAHLGKAEALKELEDYQTAAMVYSRALEINSQSPLAYNGRGECFMEMTPPDYNMAMNDFNNALDLDRSYADALSNLGHIYVNFGNDPQRGMNYLDEALAINPQDARAYRDRGLAHAQLREFIEAVADLQQAIATDNTDYENFETLATIHLAQEQYAEAADALTQAIASYKDRKDVKSGEPKIYLNGHILRADARLRFAETAADTDARQAAIEGALADADAVLADYPDRFPESGRALFRRGRAERMLERYSDAVDSFRRSIEAVPPGQGIEYISDAFLFRGICWFYIGSLDLARGDFEQASATGNGFQDPRIFLWIGFTHHKQGEYREAIEAYSQAIAKSPAFALAHTNKGRAYMDLQEYDKAIESFNDAIRAEPDVGEHYYNVGFAYIQLEEFQTAVDFLNLALRQDSPEPKMYRAMAVALRGLGRDQLAEEYEQQADSPDAASGG